jgi:nucleoside-diphosphate-sugar epimerase
MNPGTKPRALVTGAAGFIGSHVARWLLAEGMEVVALDDLSGGFRQNVPAGAKWVEASVTDYARLGRLFEAEQFDYVYHLAAYAAEGLSHFIRRFNYETNLIGSVNLINLAVLHSVRCFVFTSSIAVYGAHQLPMTEDLTPQPEDPYGVSKYAVELDLRAARRQFRPQLGGVPPPQRVRRASEHQRQVPQRDRHLHESGLAGQALDDLRRRPADARLLVHRRRGAGDRPGGAEPRHLRPGV